MNKLVLNKILIVDEAEMILLNISHVSNTEAAEMVVCKKNDSTGTASNNTRFDLILGDIGLSGINGTVGTELLRCIKNHFDPKAIIMAGYESYS